jgi:hypothetical protein
MIQVSLDTSFLISFADPDRPNHAVAVDYFRHCLAQQIPMWTAAGRRIHSRPAGTTGPRRASAANPAFSGSIPRVMG